MQPGVHLRGGSVPLLCLLLANVGLRLLESRGFNGLAYADDVVILVGGKFLSNFILFG